MHLPDFTLPPVFAAVGRRLPQRPPALALVAALNLALGRVLSRETLEPLLGKRLLIRVSDAGADLAFVLTETGFRAGDASASADLCITARVRDFLALALREEDADTLFFSRRLLMEGDTELGLLVKNTLDAIELPPLQVSELAPWRIAARIGAGLGSLPLRR